MQRFLKHTKNWNAVRRKLKHIKKCEEVDNAFNIEDMLDFVADSYGVEFSIFDEIYETYWNRKDNTNV